MKIRFRTDGWHFADLKAKGTTAATMRNEYGYNEHDVARFEALPPAEPGDCWRVRWHKEEGDGPIAGYAICCPLCKNIHAWTTASNCASRLPGGSCQHSGNGSCWNWTGSAEDGTLTASPSLYCQESLGGCGWHGWLQNGDLHT